MSKKQHRKQVARAQQKRRSDRFERRSARNRIVIFIMAGLMVLSLVAGALASLLSGRDAGARATDAESDPVGQLDDAPFEVTVDPDTDYLVTFATTEGDITVELDAGGTPLAASNLLHLAEDGYYDGVIFHRVIEDFMIQGGDPTGTGRGGPGYRFPDELEPATELTDAEGVYPRGTLAMANSGADTNGSQFFIIHQDYPLEPLYTAFGRVVEGMEVVDEIATTETDAADRPVSEIAIRSVSVEEN